jgi:arsenate reductase-like glutaredoxin family protein
MKKLLLFALPLALVFGSCSTSKVTTSWNQSKQTPAHFQKILVVGLFDNKNRDLRQQMEDQLAQELRQEGYDAVTSVSVYGPKSFQNISEEQALKEVRSRDIDGVITIGLVNTDKQKNYVRNYTYRPYSGWHYNPWYGWVYRPYYMPGFYGHYETNINYVFETNLYDVHNEQLIYSVQTRSNNPSNVYVLADDYSKSVAKDLYKKNILGS